MANVIRVDIEGNEDVSDALGNVAGAAVKTEKVVVSSAGNMEDALDKTAKEGGSLGGAFDKLENTSSGLVGGFGALTDSIGNFIDASRASGQQASELARKQTDVEQAFQDTKQAASDLKQAQIDLRQAGIDLAQAGQDIEQAQADASQALIDAEQAQKDYNAAVTEFGPNSTEAKQAAQDLKQAQLDLKQANIDVTQAQADQAQATQDAEQAQNDYSQATIDAKTANLDLADATREAKPPGWLGQAGQELSLIAPIIMGVVSSVELLTLANNALSLSWIKTAATAVAARVATIAGTIATGAATIAQWALNVAMTANPIGLIIAAIVALIAVIVLVATKTQFFQTIWEYIWGFLKAVGAWFAGPFADFFIKAWDVITGAFSKAWNWIKDTFTSAVLWIKGWQDRIFGIFQAIPGFIRDAFMSIMDYITWPFRTAFNYIAKLWNATVGQLSFHIPDWVPGIGGAGFSMPKLPTFATGGDIIRSGLAVVHKGERIQPAAGVGLGAQDGNGGPPTLRIELSGGPEEFRRWIRKNTRIYGGGGANSVQIAWGSAD